MFRQRTYAVTATLICLGITLIGNAPARAVDAPACGRESLGQVSCFSPTLCECVFDRGGSVTGTPAGYRWDCGNLRPTCGESAQAPATINPYNGPYPLAIGIDRSNQSVDIR